MIALDGRFAGALNILHLCVLHAVPVVVMQRFDPDAFCRIIEQYKVTFAFIAPPVLVVLARHPGELPPIFTHAEDTKLI